MKYALALTIMLLSSLASGHSSEELNGRADAQAAARDRSFERDLKRHLAEAERQFQANKGRTYLSESEIRQMENSLGIRIGKAYRQAPRVSNNKWDWDSRTKKKPVVITDAGIFCRGGSYIGSMNCFYMDGRPFKSYEYEIFENHGG